MADPVKATLDACVLFPTVLREILLGVAAEGLFIPVWSERILQEWVRATDKLGPAARLQAEAEATMVRTRFPAAMTRARPEIEARLWLPDTNDLHVLATAIASHSDCLITFNAQDFPGSTLAEEGIQRRDPDGFLWELAARHEADIAAVVARVHATAEKMAGMPLAPRALLKRAKLNRLGKQLYPH